MKRRSHLQEIATFIHSISGVNPLNYSETDDEGTYIDLSSRKFRWAMVEEVRRQRTEETKP